MKKKSSGKATQPQIVPPSKHDTAIPGEQPPPGFEFLVGKTPVEIVAEMNPNVKNFEALSAAMSGLGFDLGLEVPEWAKAASRKLHEAIGTDDCIAKAGEGDFSGLGKLIGFMEKAQEPKNEMLKSSKLEKLKQDFCQSAKRDAADTSPEKSKQFFDGRVKGGKSVEKMKGLARRTKIFFLISVAWQHVAQFENAGDLHRWLLEQGAIDSLTDPAETRTVCRLIGLKLRDKAGRPPNLK